MKYKVVWVVKEFNEMEVECENFYDAQIAWENSGETGDLVLIEDENGDYVAFGY